MKIYRGDVRDKKLLEEQIKQADVILPLACLTGAPLCAKEPQNAQAINYDAIRMISDLKSPSQMLIYPCTNTGYGVGEDIQLLHGCEVANRSCDCVLPWKTGIGLKRILFRANSFLSISLKSNCGIAYLDGGLLSNK